MNSPRAYRLLLDERADLLSPRRFRRGGFGAKRPEIARGSSSHKFAESSGISSATSDRYGRNMQMKQLVLAAILASLPNFQTLAQSDEFLLKFNIDEAIQFGLKSKNIELYKLPAPARWSWPPRVGGYTTPFLRVALAANAAKRKYKTSAAVDVPQGYACARGPYHRRLTKCWWHNRRQRRNDCRSTEGRKRSE
jgi:hypothetical protein